MGQVRKIQLEGSTLGTKTIIYRCVGEHVYFTKMDDNIAQVVAKVVKTLYIVNICKKICQSKLALLALGCETGKQIFER